MSIYKRAFHAWGIEPQLLKTVEELSELQRAIARYLILRCIGRNENMAKQEFAKDVDFWDLNDLTKNIVEEIVDCEIMLNQLKEYFDENLYAQYRTEKLIKLDRLLKETETE